MIDLFRDFGYILPKMSVYDYFVALHSWGSYVTVGEVSS